MSDVGGAIGHTKDQTVTDASELVKMSDAGIVLLAARAAEGKLGLHYSLLPEFAKRLDQIGRRLATQDKIPYDKANTHKVTKSGPKD